MRYHPMRRHRLGFLRSVSDNEIYITNSWSVKMAVDGKLPKLTQNGVDKLLANPFDPEHIMSIVDTKNSCLRVHVYVVKRSPPTIKTIKFQKKLSQRSCVV